MIRKDTRMVQSREVGYGRVWPRLHWKCRREVLQQRSRGPRVRKSKQSKGSVRRELGRLARGMGLGWLGTARLFSRPPRRPAAAPAAATAPAPPTLPASSMRAAAFYLHRYSDFDAAVGPPAGATTSSTLGSFDTRAFSYYDYDYDFWGHFDPAAVSFFPTFSSTRGSI